MERKDHAVEDICYAVVVADFGTSRSAFRESAERVRMTMNIGTQRFIGMIIRQRCTTFNVFLTI